MHFIQFFIDQKHLFGSKRPLETHNVQGNHSVVLDTSLSFASGLFIPLAQKNIYSLLHLTESQ